ncbi:ARM repeat-containing protein [Eremomyces bilateralis CBS 781.70]|uniref:Pumilio homology domain family member 3 n=1 Tax=Eremomyces bilateralis CBS 781.70 TaxID=1392243 RepID=A0A6G1FZ75_9PEZI|nr:ARM repeat-containing protein [Eremomyces bilateralis CBS 781.70]KAF1810976.1 ARM repeat-containing protein [Eremomyces bilateralis CBS 781.70]
MPVEIPKGPREQEGSVGLRSALLEEFINTWKFRKWELKDMRHHVVEFSGHQLASRQIQDKLGSSNSEEKSRFFEELLPNATQLMADVFGNYVIQKLFEHCDQNQKKLLAMEMKTHVVSLSVQMYGCRVVQKALEHILVDQQAELIKELDGHVLRCVKDQNGNHVVQKAIERIPSEHIQFIADAFTGQVGQLAKHSYGCRVIQRMLERCDDRTKRTLLNELHGEGDRLIADQYGNYVTQHAIEHGSPEDRTKIITHVKTRILMFSRHKFASNVVEKCLVHGTSAQRHEMMLRILEQCPRNPGVASNEALFQLLKDAYGNYVVQKLLDTVDDEDYELFAAQCIPEMPRVKEFAQGKQVQALDEKLHQRALYRAMPTLTPSGSGTPPLEDDTQSPDGVSNPSPREDMHIALSMRPELNGKASAGIQAQFSVPDIGVEPFPEPDSDPDSS